MESGPGWRVGSLSPVRLTVLGSNGTYPTVGRPASGYLLAAGGQQVLLDCGPGVFAALHERGVVPDVIVLSHGHGDHCSDVVSLLNYLRFDRSEYRGIPLLAPRGVVNRLAAFVGAGPDHLFFDVFAPDLVMPGSVIRFGNVTLSFAEAVHPVPAVSVRVAAGGVSLTYSGDTGPGGGLADLAVASDLMLCEATHQGVPAPDRYPYHLYASETGGIATVSEVAALLVTHVAPTLDPDVSVIEAAREFDGPVAHAAPGMEVDL
jgi:ribonuclease BN (tRNA processing enzyme)